MTTKFTGLLFDLDGTLIDTTDLIIQSFQHAFRKNYNRDLPEADIHAFFGKPLRDAMEHFGPDKVDDLLKTYREHNLVYHDQLAKSFVGVVEALHDLHNMGIKMAIVTSKRHDTALRGLRLFNLDKYFTVIIGLDECQHHKPHPEPVQNALSALALQPAQCLMIGDSPFDMLSAQAAGVKTAAVRWTYVSWDSLISTQPDYVLETMKDLVRICKN